MPETPAPLVPSDSRHCPYPARLDDGLGALSGQQGIVLQSTGVIGTADNGEAIMLDVTTAAYAYYEGERMLLCTLGAPTSITVIRSGRRAICVAAQKHAIPRAAGSPTQTNRKYLLQRGIQSDAAESTIATSRTTPGI